MHVLICTRVVQIGVALDLPVLHRPQKKNEKPIFRANPRLEAPLPPFILGTTFRNSAVTPASTLIKKSTTLRSSLWCSHCSVAKRLQFSCPLGTATLSLKLDNVVPGCWICFSLTVAKCFFYCSSIDEQYSYHTQSHIYDVTFSSTSTAVQYTEFFCPHFFVF